MEPKPIVIHASAKCIFLVFDWFIGSSVSFVISYCTAITLVLVSRYSIPWTHFSKFPKSFCTRKAIGKSRSLSLQSCFIRLFLISTEAPFTGKLKLALRIRNVSGAFEKRTPIHTWSEEFENERFHSDNAFCFARDAFCFRKSSFP